MRKIIEVSRLIVSPENYRFEPVANEEQAIDTMLKIKDQEILHMARHIGKYGLDPAKSIRVLKEKENYRVLDGNRRITAIKCLNNPSLVKDIRLKENFQSLHDLFRNNLIKEVECFVFPDEKTASEWIRLDHTGKNDGEGQDQWGPKEKERFDYKFGGKFSPAMQAVEHLRLEGVKINLKKLKTSTVNRIFSNPECREYLGIDITRGKLSFASDKDQSLSRIKKLFDKIIQENTTVAVVYEKNKAIKFMSELFGTKLLNGNKRTTENTQKKTKDALLNDPTKDLPIIKVPPQRLNIFVIMAFAGLDDVFDVIKQTIERLLVSVKVFMVQSPGARDTLDQKIETSLETSDFLIVVLSMGDKEKLAYQAIKQSVHAKDILEKFFPINHNVLVELGYGLRCVRSKGKDKDMFLIVEDKKDGDLPTLKRFCSNGFFDIRNRPQTYYKDMESLKKELTSSIKNSNTLKPYLKN